MTMHTHLVMMDKLYAGYDIHIYTSSFHLFISHVLYHRDLENCEVIIFIRLICILIGAGVFAMSLISVTI